MLNFKYQMDYVQGVSKWNDTQKLFGHIVLSIEDGEYKIHTLTLPEWFGPRSMFDEWE